MLSRTPLFFKMFHRFFFLLIMIYFYIFNLFKLSMKSIFDHGKSMKLYHFVVLILLFFFKKQIIYVNNQLCIYNSKIANHNIQINCDIT